MYAACLTLFFLFPIFERRVNCFIGRCHQGLRGCFTICGVGSVAVCAPIRPHNIWRTWVCFLPFLSFPFSLTQLLLLLLEYRFAIVDTVGEEGTSVIFYAGSGQTGASWHFVWLVIATSQGQHGQGGGQAKVSVTLFPLLFETNPPP